MEEKIIDQHKKKEKLKSSFVTTSTGYILSGFGLVAALSWNDAIQNLFKVFFGDVSQGGVIAKFLYAIIVTYILVLVARRFERNEGQN